MGKKPLHLGILYARFTRRQRQTNHRYERSDDRIMTTATFTTRFSQSSHALMFVNVWLARAEKILRPEVGETAKMAILRPSLSYQSLQCANSA